MISTGAHAASAGTGSPTILGRMATWTDGAAYAPIERPDGFASPVADPLPVAAPYSADTPGAVPQPSGFAPMPQAPPLNALGTPPTTNRNPAAPFEVRSALLTTTPGYGPRNPHTPFAVTTVTTTGSTGQTAPPHPAARLDTPGAPPFPGAPYAAPPQPIPAVTSAQRTFYVIAGFSFLFGTFLPSAAPWLFIAGGGLLLRTEGYGRQLGFGAIGAGMIAMLPLLYGGLPPLTFLLRWTGIGLSVGSLLIGLSRRPR